MGDSINKTVFGRVLSDLLYEITLSVNSPSQSRPMTVPVVSFPEDGTISTSSFLGESRINRETSEEVPSLSMTSFMVPAKTAYTNNRNNNGLICFFLNNIKVVIVTSTGSGLSLPNIPESCLVRIGMLAV